MASTRVRSEAPQANVPNLRPATIVRLKSPSVRLKASSGLSREMTVRSRAWGVLSLEPNVPSESTCVYSAEISVLRKAARVDVRRLPFDWSHLGS